jgi:3-oxoacyl-[acyl-carrier-protein] synthase II
MTRIAITGIGVVAPCGIGIEAFAAFLDGGESAASIIDRFDTSGMQAHTAGLVRGFVPKDFIAPMKLRRMNNLSRFGVAAARLAIADLGSDLSSAAGVAIGTAFGPVQTSMDYLQEYVEKGAALAPPQLFAESVANAPGSHVGIEFGLRGFNITVTQRESSAMAALMYASSQIAKGIVPAAVIGGVDEVNEIVFGVLDRLGSLAHANGVVDERARPFDRRRNGMMVGEGGAVLIAESLRRDGAYAFVSGFGIARDTTASISDWGDGTDAVAVAMRAAIDDAELSIDDIDAIYASANSTVRADRLEWRAIGSVFPIVPPVVATKGYFGEYAAGGAMQLIAATLALRDQALHKSAGFAEVDPEMRFTPTRERSRRELRNILVNSISAGGGIVCAVLSREAA